MKRQKIMKMWQEETGRLGQSRHGRVLLHLGCLVAHPSHFQWHWHGILRELAYAH